MCKVGPTYSLAMGTDPLRFGLAITLAWFRVDMVIMEGRSRQGSPSTCIGIDLVVVNLTS